MEELGASMVGDREGARVGDDGTRVGVNVVGDLEGENVGVVEGLGEGSKVGLVEGR